MPVIHRRTDHDDDSASGESSPFLDSKKDMGNLAKLYRMGGYLCFFGLFAFAVTRSGAVGDVQAMGLGTAVVGTKSSGSPGPMADYPNLTRVFSEYKNCELSWTPPPPRPVWDTKPLWLSAFPGSGTTGPTNKGDIMKPLINGITGLKAGAKFFHASSKILKRCKGQDESVTCAQGHPVVDVSPAKQKNNFYHSIILVTRNVKTSFPVHINEKAEAYHDADGPIGENEWRKSRDDWYKEVFANWKSVITAWKEMDEYDIGMYLQYEELMDPDRGPGAVQRLADTLQIAGFKTAPEEDLPCIWSKVVKDEYLRLKDYSKYSYGYTEEQRQYLLKELETFQKEVADDKKLVAILKEYYKDIQDNTYIDVPYQKR